MGLKPGHMFSPSCLLSEGFTRLRSSVASSVGDASGQSHSSGRRPIRQPWSCEDGRTPYGLVCNRFLGL